MVTVAPLPVVVVVATVVAPWSMFIVNWSLANCRPVTASVFCNIRCGKGVSVYVHCTASPNANAPKLYEVVTAFDGNGVVDPAVALVHVIDER